MTINDEHLDNICADLSTAATIAADRVGDGRLGVLREDPDEARTAAQTLHAILASLTIVERIRTDRMTHLGHNDEEDWAEHCELLRQERKARETRLATQRAGPSGSRRFPALSRQNPPDPPTNEARSG